MVLGLDIEDEAITNISLVEALHDGVDVLEGSHLDDGGNALVGAKIEDLLSALDAADERTVELEALEEHGESRDLEGR